MLRKTSRAALWLMLTATVLAAPLAAGSALAETTYDHSIVEGPTVVWNASLWGTRRAQSEGLEALATIVSERTEGRFTINLQYAEALSPTRENIDGIMIGAFEMAHTASVFHPDKVPTLNVFDLPFLPLSDLKVQAKVMRQYLEHPAVQADLARWNAVGFMPVLLPAYEMQGRGEPPKGVDSLNGLKVRAPGGLGAVLKTVGAAPVSVASSEMYGALQQGIVDATVLPHYSAISFRTYELSDWFSTNLGLGTLGVVTLVNQDAWNALPEQYRTLLNDSVEEALEIQIAAYDVAQQEAVQGMLGRGMSEVKFPEEQIALLIKAAGPVWDNWLAEMNANGYPADELLKIVLDGGNTE